MDYEIKSVEDLERMNTEMSRQRDEHKAEQRALQAVLNRKRAAKEMADKVADMSDAEKAQMRQVLSAGSIPSEETVGKPGA